MTPLAPPPPSESNSPAVRSSRPLSHVLPRRIAAATLIGSLLLVSVATPLAANSPDKVQGPVVVSGTVPDEATRHALIARIREVYTSAQVIDQLGVGNVVAPANWQRHMLSVIDPRLQQVRRGQLQVHGNTLELAGEVSSDTVREALARDTAGSLNPTYAIRNALRVDDSAQGQLDAALAERTIEFEPGSAVLRPSGRAILNEMATAVVQLEHPRVAVIGHTDAMGSRDANVLLSLARADAVRRHLTTQGVPADRIHASGAGPDHPVATNDTPEGRARNRRIEFRVIP